MRRENTYTYIHAEYNQHFTKHENAIKIYE
jgi:hypothetical protein